MDAFQLHDGLAAVSGTLVGFSLGLIGGGGSILAVPLLLYVVGVSNPHVAIGTSALAVAVNAFANLLPHARENNVCWPEAIVFAVAGVVGASLGSTLGKVIDGQKLLSLFSLLMLLVAFLMLRGRREGGERRGIVWPGGGLRLGAIGAGAGGLSGLFGIGGGFLIVPGLMFGARLPLIKAIGSSLVAVGAFGLTTAVNYAASGLVDYRIAGEYLLGGLLGGWIGVWAAGRLSQERALLNRIFAGVLVLVAAYMQFRSLSALGILS